MSLCHGWGWQPPQPASHIYIRHIQCILWYSYAVHRHTVAVAACLNRLYHTTWLRFGGSGSLVESKWYHYIMVEADSQLKLCPTSILDIQRLWAHWYAIAQPYTVIPTLLGSDFGARGVTCGVKLMSLLRGWGWQTTQTASCVHITQMQSVWAH